MRIAVDRATFERGLSIAGRAISTKNVIPILSGVYLRACGSNRLILRATDMARSIRTEIACKAETEGSIIVSAKLLTEWVHKVEGDEVLLSANGKGQVELRAGKSKYVLPFWPGEQFPQEPNVSDAYSIVVKQDELRRLIDRTAYAAKTEDEDVRITCLRLHLKGNRLTANASNQAILAQAHMTVDNRDDANFEVMVTAREAKDLAKLLNEGEATLKVTGNHLVVEANGITFSTLLVSAVPLPDFDKFIPAKPVTTVTVNRAELLGAVDRCDSVHPSVQLNVMDAGDGGNIALDSYSDDGGRAHEDVTSETSGEPQNVLIKGPYTLKILSNMDGPTVTIRFAGGKAPMMLTDSDDGYCIMQQLTYR